MLAYVYNDLDQITSITYPDGKQEIYTYSSCCPKLIDSYTDRSNRTTYYTYDAMKRLTLVKNPDNTLIKYDYDADGNMIRLTDTNGGITRYYYDSSDRLVKKLYADGKGDVYTYDVDDLLVSKKNARDITATYSYNENNKLTDIIYSDGTTPEISFVYDAYNRVTSRTDGIGTWNYTYDADSRLKTVKTPWDTATTPTYVYDDKGRRTSLQQLGGDTINYAYNDPLGWLSTIAAGSRTFTYAYTTGSPSPIPASLTRPNGSVTAYQIDALDRLTQIANKDVSHNVINATDFTYNSSTNVDMRDTETITNGLSINLTSNLVTYNYNNVNQLTNSTSPTRTYSYDADGNMTSWVTPDGYMVTATYDAENRLTYAAFTDSQNVQHSYAFYYSGDGLLAKQVIDGVETRFVRDDNFNVVQERDGSNTVSRSYAWNPDAPGGIEGLLELTQGGSHYNYLYDGKGNVSAVIDSNQGVVASYKYDDFGNLVSKSGTLDQPYMFSTKPYYASLGQNYYGYRFYSPSLGRWMTRDRLMEAGGLNLYKAMLNNVINAIDPDALIAHFDPGGGGTTPPSPPFGNYGGNGPGPGTGSGSGPQNGLLTHCPVDLILNNPVTDAYDKLPNGAIPDEITVPIPPSWRPVTVPASKVLDPISIIKEGWNNSRCHSNE
jgi:RHS repeat-associated protein